VALLAPKPDIHCFSYLIKIQFNFYKGAIRFSMCDNREQQLRRLASGRDVKVIDVVRSVDTNTTAREGLPDEAPVGTTVAVSIGLDPGVTASGEGGVARLDCERVEEEVREDDVALSAAGVGEGGGGPAVLSDERGVDLVEDVGPDGANACEV
jgi:hypothetical protein